MTELFWVAGGFLSGVLITWAWLSWTATELDRAIQRHPAGKGGDPWATDD